MTHNPIVESRPPIRIDRTQLASATLRKVIEEFVTRDGTELTDSDTKVTQVEALLDRGEVELWFDHESQTCNILPADSQDGDWGQG